MSDGTETSIGVYNTTKAALIYLNAGSVEGFTVPLGISYAMTAFSPGNGGQGDVVVQDADPALLTPSRRMT